MRSLSLKPLTILVLLITLTACSSSSNSTISQSSNETLGSGSEEIAVNWSAGVDVLQATETWLKERVKERREDGYGSYTVTTLEPLGQQDVLNLGIAEGRLSGAIAFFTDFVATEVLDSISLDDNSRFQEWVDTKGQFLLTAEALSLLERNHTEGRVANIIFNNFDYSALNLDNSSAGSPAFNSARVLPLLIRDGGPRMFNKKLWGVEAAPVGVGFYVRASGTAVYSTTQSAAGCLSWQVSSFINEDGETVQNEVCLDPNPEAPSYGLFRFHIGLHLVPDGDSFRIAAFSNYFKIEQPPYVDGSELPEGASPYPEFFKKAREDLKN